MSTVLDALVMAKALSAFGAANSLANFLLPRQMLSIYHRKDGSRPYVAPPRKVQIFKNTATCLLSFSVIAIGTIFGGLSINKSVALCQIPWVIHVLRSLFIDQNWKYLGQPILADLPPLTAGPLFTYFSWNESDVSSLIFGAFMLFNGCSVLWNPSTHRKMWQDKNQWDAAAKSSLKTLGLAMNALGTIIVSMAYFNESPARAFGFSWMWLALMSILPLLSNDAKRLGLNKSALMVWVPINLFAFLILVDGN